MLRFGICMQGVGFEMRVGFCVFGKMGVFSKKLAIWFLGSNFKSISEFQF